MKLYLCTSQSQTTIMKKSIMSLVLGLVVFASCSKADLPEPKKQVQQTSTSVGKLTSSVQCSGTTKTGKRCQNKTLSKNGKCYLHGGN